MNMNFIEFLNIIKINNRFIFNLKYYISRFEIPFIYKINNIKNIF